MLFIWNYIGKGKYMNDRLTRNDIKKMEEEIEHRKLVIRKEALEAVKGGTCPR